MSEDKRMYSNENTKECEMKCSQLILSVKFVSLKMFTEHLVTPG